MKTYTNPTGTEEITLKAGEELDIQIQDLDVGSREFTLVVRHQGSRSRCSIVGRALSSDKDNKTWKVSQIFEGENQEGLIDLRGVAEDNAFLDFDGTGILEQTSIDGTINISEKIQLYDKAKAKSLPVLTVRTDKVKGASHGASIAPVSDDQLIYLMSRGITKKVARDMLREGFLRF